VKALPAKAADDSVRTASPRRPGRAWIARVAILCLALLLLWWAFRGTPLAEIIRTLARLQPWQVGVVMVVNIAFHVLMGMRWWFLAKPDVSQVRLLDLVFVRLGAFGLSYFTPGPQLGGEPLQVLFLRLRHSASFARATSTVIMDRLVELLAGFFFMVLGVTALLREGLMQQVSSLQPALLVPLALVMAWPLVHIFLLWRGHYPVSGALSRIPWPRAARKLLRLTRASEHLAGRFCQRRPGAVIAALVATLLGASLAVMEYALVTSFLDIRLSAWQVMAGWTSGWLSFLIPLPGALGALEGSQVIALGSCGITSAAALGVALVLRARDLLFAGAGFVLAARQLQQVMGRWRT
jgi:hypothetical protein